MVIITMFCYLIPNGICMMSLPSIYDKYIFIKQIPKYKDCNSETGGSQRWGKDCRIKHPTYRSNAGIILMI